MASATTTPDTYPIPLDGDPLNREPAITELVSNFITSGSAYDRNHGPIPRIRRDEHRVRVDGAVSNPLSLSVHDLVTSFPQHEVVCVLQCASNRRHTMRTSLKEVDGIDWGDAALMNCSWRGPRLCDILERAGVARGEQDAHVGFAYEATETQNDCWYGASTELARALDRDNDIIVATERNSVLLSAEHGAPVRIIVPGVAGARSVKWVDHITVQQKESSNYYQNRDYKVLPEHVSNAQEAEGYWDTTPALQDMPVNSVVALPRCGETISAEQDGCIVVRGYAVPGGRDGPVTKVEISVDGQKTWTEATIRGSPSKWSWALWSVRAQAPLKAPIPRYSVGHSIRVGTSRRRSQAGTFVAWFIMATENLEMSLSHKN